MQKKILEPTAVSMNLLFAVIEGNSYILNSALDFIKGSLLNVIKVHWRGKCTDTQNK